MVNNDPKKKGAGKDSWISGYNPDSESKLPNISNTPKSKSAPKDSWLSDYSPNDPYTISPVKTTPTNITPQIPPAAPPVQVNAIKGSILTRISQFFKNIPSIFSVKHVHMKIKKTNTIKMGLLAIFFLVTLALAYSIYISYNDPSTEIFSNPYDISKAGFGGTANNFSKIQEIREKFADFKDIDGIVWDEKNQIPIIISKKETTNNKLTPADLDDLILVMKIIDRHDNPGISIEPNRKDDVFMYIGSKIRPPLDENIILPLKRIVPGLGKSEYDDPGYHIVKYYPEETYGTHLGLTMFETDVTLKALSSGVDPITKQPVSLSVLGFKTGKDRAIEYHSTRDFTGPGQYSRTWFKPKQSVVTESQNVMIIDNITMGVLSETDYQSSKDFAQFFEDHYNEIASEKPIYQELIRVQKYVAISRWLKERGYLDKCKLLDYKISIVNTPYKVPAIRNIIKSETKGDIISQYSIVGGVALDTRNMYNSGKDIIFESFSFVKLPEIVIQSRPEKAIEWEFKVGASTYQAIALA